MHPVLFHIGGLEIRYYGLMYAIAFIIGIVLARHEAKRYGLNVAMIEEYCIVAMISGLIGGRAYYVLLEHNFYFANPSQIIAVWHGGMAIHGGIIGGIIGTVIYGKIKKINPWLLGDILAAPFILGQAIGRIGNLMNGDANGVPLITPFKAMITNHFEQWWAAYQMGMAKAAKPLLPWGIVFPAGTPAGDEFPGMATYPVMVYEMILNFIAFLLIWFVFRKKGYKPGSLFCIYLIAYGIIRGVVTTFRGDDLMMFGIRAPYVMSIIMIVFGLIMFFYFNRKTVRKK